MDLDAKTIDLLHGLNETTSHSPLVTVVNSLFHVCTTASSLSFVGHNRNRGHGGPDFCHRRIGSCIADGLLLYHGSALGTSA